MAHFSNLDFESIKEELKTYFEQQPEFSDYDFEGSALNVLLGELAYFAHYMGYYADFLYNEELLPEATTRNAVVKKARELSYLPSQKKASQAVVNLEIDLSDESNPPDEIVVSRGTQFTSQKDNNSFTFTVTEEQTLTDDNDNKIYNGDVTINEGEFLDYRWTYNSGERQRFIIPNSDVDINFLNVFVEDNSGNRTKWTRFGTIKNVGQDDTVYFLWEIENNLLEIEFTNSVNIGRNLEDGYIIDAEYFVTSGAEGNGLKVFELNDSIAGYPASDYTVTLVQGSAGGSDEESIESIRQLAPISYEAQDRAVTARDYKVLIENNFPNLQTIRVWGGEENDPPDYGRVYVSAKPEDEDDGTVKLYMDDTTKTQVKDFVNEYKVLGVRPKIVDPYFISMDTFFEIYFNPTLTNLSRQEVKNDIEETVNEFFEANIREFRDILWESQLLTTIDNLDYVTASRVEITLKRTLPLDQNTEDTGQSPYYPLVVKFLNEIDSTEPEAVITEPFGDGSPKPYIMRDNSSGNIEVYNVVDEQVEPGYEDIGEVDYENGVLYIEDIWNQSPSLSLESPSEDIVYKILPRYNNIFSRTNFLLKSPPDTIGVTLRNV